MRSGFFYVDLSCGKNPLFIAVAVSKLRMRIKVVYFTLP
jgi:hypothetical protein